jgi:polyisoprenoid-binding protein YceI
VSKRSAVSFKCGTLWGFATVKGSFSDVSGESHVTSVGAVFGRVSIRAASLTTGIVKRDAHLRSCDYFDVEAYPDLGLVVTAAVLSGHSRAELRCRLTIKKTTKMVVMPVALDFAEDGSIGVSGRICLNRAEFGLSGNLFGMMAPTTTVFGELVFRRSTAEGLGPPSV